MLTVFQAFSTDSQFVILWASIQSEPIFFPLTIAYYLGIAFVLGQLLINVFLAVFTTVFTAVRAEAQAELDAQLRANMKDEPLEASHVEGQRMLGDGYADARMTPRHGHAVHIADGFDSGLATPLSEVSSAHPSSLRRVCSVCRAVSSVV